MANGVTLLLLSPPGVGKTHLAVALDREVVRLGHSNQYIGTMELINTLAKAQHTLEARLMQYAKTRLLIIGEVDYLPLETNATYLFSQLILRCDQRGSVLISSNRPVMEWEDVFSDQVGATAILDRLQHHSPQQRQVTPMKHRSKGPLKSSIIEQPQRRSGCMSLREGSPGDGGLCTWDTGLIDPPPRPLQGQPRTHARPAGQPRRRCRPIASRRIRVTHNLWSERLRFLLKRN